MTRLAQSDVTRSRARSPMASECTTARISSAGPRTTSTPMSSSYIQVLAGSTMRAMIRGTSNSIPARSNVVASVARAENDGCFLQSHET